MTSKIFFKLLAAVLALTVTASVSQARPKADGGVRIYAAKGSYDDIKQELVDAIINRGFKIDYNGKIGAMLERTSKDTGVESAYKNAEFFTFCSATYSGQAMKADPRTIGFCPYVLFIYELKSKPGEILLGYRRPALIGPKQSKDALTKIDKLLDKIARDAVN